MHRPLSSLPCHSSQRNRALALLLLGVCSKAANGWVQLNDRQQQQHHPSLLLARKYIDADFERVPSKKVSPYKKGQGSKKKKSSSSSKKKNDDYKLDLDETENLIDMSFELDQLNSESQKGLWSTTRVPFCRGTEYIDVKVAFTVDVEGETYGIGVPFDAAAAIVISDREKDDGETVFINPDTVLMTEAEDRLAGAGKSEEEQQDAADALELMEIMAVRLSEHVGKELKLRKTPKVLTISGGLDKYTDDWESKLTNKPYEIDELLKIHDTGDDDLNAEEKEFLDFMRKELGDDVVDKVMSGEDDEDDPDLPVDELMDLFTIPGMGTAEDDEEGIEEILNEIKQDLETGGVPEQFSKRPENVSLKLISFEMKDGKSYSLVKLLEPYTLVGRFVQPTADQEDMFHFDLLTPEEETLLIPRLEEICSKELEEAGLSFSS